MMKFILNSLKNILIGAVTLAGFMILMGVPLWLISTFVLMEHVVVVLLGLIVLIACAIIGESIREEFYL